MASPLTLLQIVNKAQGELGLPKSSSVIGNTTDPIAVQMLDLSNEAGEEIRDYNEIGWTSMYVEFNLAVKAPVATTGNTTSGSAVITNIQPNTTGLTAGASSYVMAGNAIPTAARVKSIDSSSQITMDMLATGNSTAEAILFVQDTYQLPSDYKTSQNRTQWDRTNHWELLGPDSPQMDMWHRSGIVALGPRRHFRFIGHATNTLRFWPPPSELVNPLQIAFEYISTDWVNISNAGVTTSDSWSTDADTSFLDSRLLIKWLKWKYWQMKGFAYDVLRNDAIEFMETLIGRDGAAPTLHMSKRVHSMFLSPAQIIDGNFPGPIGPNSN